MYILSDAITLLSRNQKKKAGRWFFIAIRIKVKTACYHEFIPIKPGNKSISFVFYASEKD
jgi:hypothetical protein